MLEVKSLQFGYNEPLLSESLSCKWEKGEVVVLLGDNGVGKSTFLRTLAGLQNPISGSVILESNQIGWVDSSISKGVYLSVSDFLSFGVNATSIEVNKWFKLFGLNLEMDQFVDEISDGQFRKLCIIRQLLKKPSVLFLDEPTVYLDVKSKIQLEKVIKKIKRDCLVFCTTHDLLFAENIMTKEIKF